VQQLQQREGRLLDLEFALDFCIAELGQGVRSWKTWVLHTVIWGVSLLMAVLPLAITPGYYGRADGWCWIVSTRDNDDRSYWVAQMLRMTQYYVPLWIAVCYNLAVCGLVVVQLRRILASAQPRPKPRRPADLVAPEDVDSAPLPADEALIDPLDTSTASMTSADEASQRPSTLLLNLLWFPAVLVVSGAAATVLRVEELFNGQPRFALVVTCGAALALHGFFDTLVYAYPRAVRSQLKELVRCRTWFGGSASTHELNQGLIDHVVAHVEVAD